MLIIRPGKPTSADLGAMIALRHLEDAARRDPTASIVDIIKDARDTLMAEIKANEDAIN